MSEEWWWEPVTLDEAARLLRGFPARWWIAGGYALELFLGRSLREHGDLDVLVRRDDQAAIRAHLPDWDIRIAHGGWLEPWPAGTRVELPRHGFWARRDPAGPWELQFLLAEHDAGTWWYRRDPAVRLPLAEIGLRSPSGIPYLRPELILLFKAKHLLEKDEADFDAVLPALDAGARGRLRAWLPAGHPWLRRF